MSALSEQEHAELVAYLDGELDADAARAMESKLNLDPRFRVEADALRRTWALLDVLPKSAPAPEFASRTLSRIAALPATSTLHATSAVASPMFRRLAWAAAIVAAAGLGYMLAPPARLEVNLETDAVYKSEPRLIENLPQYLAAENLEFLQLLDTPDLFGDDAVGR